jgi:hypothetical protein
MKHEFGLCAAVKIDENSPPMMLLHQCTRCGITRLTTRSPYQEDYFRDGKHFDSTEAIEECATLAQRWVEGHLSP